MVANLQPPRSRREPDRNQSCASIKNPTGNCQHSVRDDDATYVLLPACELVAKMIRSPKDPHFFIDRQPQYFAVKENDKHHQCHARLIVTKQSRGHPHFLIISPLFSKKDSLYPALVADLYKAVLSSNA